MVPNKVIRPEYILLIDKVLKALNPASTPIWVVVIALNIIMMAKSFMADESSCIFNRAAIVSEKKKTITAIIPLVYMVILFMILIILRISGLPIYSAMNLVAEYPNPSVEKTAIINKVLRITLYSPYMSRPRKRATNIPAIKAHNFPIALPIKAHIESIISGLCLTV